MVDNPPKEFHQLEPSKPSEREWVKPNGLYTKEPKPSQVASLDGAFWARRFKANGGVKSNLAIMQ
jgi:hypothetical protein